jgi:hypothetical protein
LAPAASVGIALVVLNPFMRKLITDKAKGRLSSKPLPSFPSLENAALLRQSQSRFTNPVYRGLPGLTGTPRSRTPMATFPPLSCMKRIAIAKVTKNCHTLVDAQDIQSERRGSGQGASAHEKRNAKPELNSKSLVSRL